LHTPRRELKNKTWMKSDTLSYYYRIQFVVITRQTQYILLLDLTAGRSLTFATSYIFGNIESSCTLFTHLCLDRPVGHLIFRFHIFICPNNPIDRHTCSAQLILLVLYLIFSFTISVWFESPSRYYFCRAFLAASYLTRGRTNNMLCIYNGCDFRLSKNNIWYELSLQYSYHSRLY